MVWQSWVFIGLGLAFIVEGIAFRSGRTRANYWMMPFSYYRTAAYGSIPFGVALCIIGIGPLFYDTPWIFPLRILVISLGLLGLFMWLFQPRFARPDWVNWLEDNHNDILPELLSEIWKLRPISERKKIVNNQAAMEAWIEEFRQRRVC